jgi:hypothetical protein
MHGGLAYLVRDNMAVAASAQGASSSRSTPRCPTGSFASTMQRRRSCVGDQCTLAQGRRCRRSCQLTIESVYSAACRTRGRP